MKKSALLLSALLVITSLTACGGSPDNDGGSGDGAGEKTTVTVAHVETSQVVVEAGVAGMTALGCTLEPTLFDGNIQTITAVNDGSIDCAIAVHKPFMEKFNKENNGDLVMLEPYIYTVGMGLYSDKYDDISQLPDGAQIALINDAMNMDRGLRILRDAGLITLKDGGEGSYTALDITDNPHNFQFVELEQTQTVRSLEDVDAAICFFSHMFNAGKDYTKYLARDKNAEEYPMGVVVKKENADAPWAKELAESIRDEKAWASVSEFYKGMYELYPY